MYEDEVDPNMERLVAAHPLLFRGKHPDVSSDLPSGWYGIVDDLCRNIEEVLCDQFVCRQVKEKFGGLRFYWQRGDDGDLYVDTVGPTDVGTMVVSSTSAGDPAQERIRALVVDAMAKSEVTCDQCGQQGKLLRRRGYYSTRCDEHAGGNSSPISDDD